MQKNFSLAWHNRPDNQKNAIGSDKAAFIKKVLRRNNSIKHTNIVINLSSAIIDNQLLLNNFVENLEILSNIGLNLTIIHDYSDLLAKYFKLLDLDKKLYDLRFGNTKLYELFEMIISGYINKNIV